MMPEPRAWAVNHKKVQRLWREEGLRVPVKRRRKRVGSSTTEAPQAGAPNVVWAVDFQFDADETGRAIKIASIVDEHTRECLGGIVARSITGDDLIVHLDAIAAKRGLPQVLRCDNGPSVDLPSDGRLSWRGHRDLLHPTRCPVAQWLRGVLQQPNPRRVPEHHQLLVPHPCSGDHRRLEEGVQHHQTPLSARLPQPG